jgi:hypothetical protein
MAVDSDLRGLPGATILAGINRADGDAKGIDTGADLL